MEELALPSRNTQRSKEELALEMFWREHRGRQAGIRPPNVGYEGRKRWVGDPGIGPVFLVVSTEVAGMTLFFVGFVYIEICSSLGVWHLSIFTLRWAVPNTASRVRRVKHSSLPRRRRECRHLDHAVVLGPREGRACVLEPAMVKPVPGGLVEKLVLDDRERRNSVGQRILFVQLEFLVAHDAARLD